MLHLCDERGSVPAFICCDIIAHPPFFNSREKTNQLELLRNYASFKPDLPWDIFAFDNPPPSLKPQEREVHKEVLPDEKDLRHHEGEWTEGGPRSHVGYQVRGSYIKETASLVRPADAECVDTVVVATASAETFRK